MLTFQTFSRKPDTLLHSDDDSTKLGQHIKNRIRKYTEVVFFLGPSSMRFGCQGLKNQFELAAAQNWNSRKSLPIFKASHFISATLLQFPSLKSRAKKVLKIEFQLFIFLTVLCIPLPKIAKEFHSSSLKNMGLLFFRQINLVLSLPMETLVIFSRNLGYDIFTIAAVKSDNSFVCSALNSNKWVNPKKNFAGFAAADDARGWLQFRRLIKVLQR